MTTGAPLISIIIPSYNSAQYLSATLNSILNQGYPNFEIILVDDGSTDNTREIIDSFNDDKIIYIYQDNSGGPSKPRNVGIQSSSGLLICLFDSDDIMLETKLEDSVDLFSRSDVDLIFTDFSVIDENSVITKSSFLEDYTYFRRLLEPIQGFDHCFELKGAAYNALLNSNFIGTSSVIARRDVINEIGYFDESLKNSDDIDYWYRVALKGKRIGFIDKIEHHYRRRSGSISSRGLDNYVPIIKVLENQFANVTNEDDLSLLKKRIADVRLTFAWHAFKADHYSLAKEQYKKSLKNGITYQGIKGYLLSTVMQSIS
jgi:glycosyltransferase involved in cell wall biosynthesis